MNPGGEYRYSTLHISIHSFEIFEKISLSFFLSFPTFLHLSSQRLIIVLLPKNNRPQYFLHLCRFVAAPSPSSTKSIARIIQPNNFSLVYIIALTHKYRHKSPRAKTSRRAQRDRTDSVTSPSPDPLFLSHISRPSTYCHIFNLYSLRPFHHLKLTNKLGRNGRAFHKFTDLVCHSKRKLLFVDQIR